MSDMTMAVKVMATSPMMKLMDKVDKEIGQVYSVLPYVNGREKGFCITDNRGWERHDGLAVAFSECRGSDQLTVYVGRDALYPYEQREADKTRKKYPLNFIIEDDAVKLNDEIYHNHAYYLWCDDAKYYKQVGKVIADFLTLKINENDLAKRLKAIEAQARKGRF